MLGISNLREEPIPEQPSLDEITNFNETGRHGPSKTPGRWRPDLLGPKKSPWNKAAARRFCRHFLKCKQYGDWPAEQVERALFVHMNTLRARYKTQTDRGNLDEKLQMSIRAARISRLKTVSAKSATFSKNLLFFTHSWLDNVKSHAIGKMISQNSLLTFRNYAMKVA